MRYFLIILLLIPSMAFADDAAREYTRGKMRLMATLAAAEELKFPNVAHLDSMLAKNHPVPEDKILQNEKGEYIGPHKAVNARCAEFFSIADAIAEPTLFDECKSWGWLPQSGPSF